MARSDRRGVARFSISAASTAALVAALNLAQPALGADLGYGPYGPPPYGYQPPPYEDGTGRYLPQREAPYGAQPYLYQPPLYGPAYPPRRPLSSREDPYDQRYSYQPPPPDDRARPYPPRRYDPTRQGAYDEQRYGYQSDDRRASAYPYYRPAPNRYDHGDAPRGYPPYGYADPFYDQDRRGRMADSRELPADAPPYEAWSPYPPRRW